MFARVIAAKEAPSGKVAKARGVRLSEDSVAEQEPEEAFAPARFLWSFGNVGLSPPADYGQPHSGEAGKLGGTQHLGILPLPMQAKLEIGAVDDPLEREADHAAAQVTRVPGSGAAVNTLTSDASPKAYSANPSASGHAACLLCKPAPPQISRALSPASAAMDAPPIVNEVLRSPGRPLDQATRAFFEPRFGYDFSRVRVHSDAQSAESARAVNARAYTVGDHIAFSAGRYAPQTTEGRRLLAHELTHVAQQTRVPLPGTIGHAAPGSTRPVLQRDDDDTPSNPWDKLSPGTRKKTEALWNDCDDRIGEIDMAGLAISPKRNDWVNTLRTIRTSIENIDSDSKYQGRENAYYDTLDKILDTSQQALEESQALYKNYQDIRGWLTSKSIRATDSIEAQKYLDEIFRDFQKRMPKVFVTEDDYRPQKVAMEKQEYIRVGVLRGTRNRASELIRMMDTVGDLLMKGEDADKFVPGWSDRVLDEAQYLDSFAQLAKEQGRSYAGEIAELRDRLLEKRRETAKISPEEKSWLEKGADFVKGGVETLAGIFVEAAKEAVDLAQIYLHFYSLGKYEPNFISDMADAAKHGASTTDLLKLMATGILEAPSRFLKACRDGDWEAIGRETVNLYMLADCLRKAPETIKKFPEAVKKLPELVARTRESLTILRARMVALGLKAEGRFSIKAPAPEPHPVTDAPAKAPHPPPTQLGPLPPPPAPAKPVGATGGTGPAPKPATGLSDSPIQGGGQTTRQDPGRLGVVDKDKVRAVTPKRRQQNVQPSGTPADQTATQQQQVKRTGTDDLPPAKTVDPHAPAGKTQSSQGGASGARMGSKTGSSTTGSGQVDSAKGGGSAGGSDTSTGGTKSQGGATQGGGGGKRETVEQYKKRGGKVQEVDPGVSGAKDKPKAKQDKPVTARPKDPDFNKQRDEMLGSDKDSPEVAATRSSKTPRSKPQSLRAEIGNFAHKDLPRYLKFFADKGEVDLVAQLKQILDWPKGVEPNKLTFKMSDGRIGIPDGIDTSKGVVYELKPDSESEWAQRGEYQASEYAAQLNKEHYAGRTDWKPVVIKYKAALLEQQLREWGILEELPEKK